MSSWTHLERHKLTSAALREGDGVALVGHGMLLQTLAQPARDRCGGQGMDEGVWSVVPARFSGRS
jgi:hypothetical protein